MKIIKNASQLMDQIENRGRSYSVQGKTLLKLKPGEGFTTVKRKVQGLRVLAYNNGFTISAKATGNGSYLICRL